MVKVRRWIWLLTFALLIVGTVSGGIWYADKNNSLTEAVVVYPNPQSLNEFTLTDTHQQPFTKQSLQDHWSLLFVGYTYCPDICPTTLSDLARIYPELMTISEQTQVVFISADPKRDTPERLQEYTGYFNPHFIAVTGEHESLMPAVQQLGLIYGVYEQDAEHYLIDHSASIALVNPKGELHATFRPSFDENSNLPLVDGPELISNFSRIVDQWSF